MKTDKKSIDALKDIFLDKWGIQLNEYEDQYHRTDVWFNWNGATKDIEVKKRRFNKDKYPTTVIDADKFVSLVKGKAFLVVMFDDCWGICKNVRDAYVTCTQMWARRCTDFAADYYWKNEVELSLDKFNWFNY